MRPTFELDFVARPEHIDELGHVNNAVWVQWIQQVAVAHWEAVAPQAHKDAYFWVVIRHEIDYLRALGPGESVTGRTWVAEAPKGARFDRHMERRPFGLRLPVAGLRFGRTELPRPRRRDVVFPPRDGRGRRASRGSRAGQRWHVRSAARRRGQGTAEHRLRGGARRGGHVR